MPPVIAIIGRPNVGKSTLFNALTRTRDALVADFPGVTRDRISGMGRVGPSPYLIVDTGGLTTGEDAISDRISEQALLAVDDADSVLFLVDARDGLNSADEAIARQLRRSGRRCYLVINKTEHLDLNIAAAEFHGLGLGAPISIAAAHGRGLERMMETVLGALDTDAADNTDDDASQQHPDAIRLAIVGRPNVGKSTLVNRMLGEERVVVFDQPGTTRDSISIPLCRDDQEYVLIDTAGVRRKTRSAETIERFSIVKTLKAIEGAHVVILVIDGAEGITDQDASLLGIVIDSGKAVILAVNKWDKLEKAHKDRVKDELERKLHFIDYATRMTISALHGTGVGHLFKATRLAWKSAFHREPTARLTTILEEAVSRHAPPSVHGRRIKLRYAHQGGVNPPIVVIHGNQTHAVPASYKRYLENIYREALALQGTPVRIEFKQGNNPFKGRRNKLTPRQQKQRQRLMSHVKKKR